MRQRSDPEGCLRSYACTLLGSGRRLGSGLEGDVPIKVVFQGSLVPGLRCESRARAGTSTVQNIEFDSLMTALPGLLVRPCKASKADDDEYLLSIMYYISLEALQRSLVPSVLLLRRLCRRRRLVSCVALLLNLVVIGSLFIPVSAVSEPVPSGVCSHQTNML